MARTLVTLVTLFAFTACTTMQAVPDLSAGNLQRSIQPGDTVRVETADGLARTLQVGEVTASTLRGTVDGQPADVPIASIRSLEKAGGVHGGWIAAGVLAALAVIAVVVSGNDDDGGGGGGVDY